MSRPNRSKEPGEETDERIGVPTLGEAFQLFGRLMRLARRYWGKLAKGFLLGPIVGLFAMVPPYASKLLIDEVYPTQDVGLMEAIVWGIVASMIARAFIEALQKYYTLYVNTKLSSATRLLFFNHLQHLKPEFFNRHEVGEVNSRFDDVRKSLNSVSGMFSTLFGDGVYLLIVPPFLFYLEWRLAAIALVTIPVTVIIVVLAGQHLRSHWKKSAEAYADLNALQIETLNQIEGVKSLALEPTIYEEADEQIHHAMEMQLKAGGMNEAVKMGSSLLKAINKGLFTWLGWSFILSGQMTLGSYIAFTSYVQYLYQPLRKMVRQLTQFQETAINLRRMFRYLDKPTERPPEKAQESLGEINDKLRGDISITGVSFGYNGETVVSDVNVQIDDGETVALIGETGCGKTTILRMIAGMGVPETGTVQIDGREVRSFDVHRLRRQIGTVWQDVSVFRGTVWSNLTIGHQNPQRDEVERAVRMAKFKKVVEGLSERYETPVGEDGSTLSGGERQRLAIARCLLQDAPIYLLDEATSDLDMQTEKEVLNNILEWARRRTVVFVTHRVSSAVKADRIFLMRDGEVLTSGPHETLIQSCSEYRDLHEISSATGRKSAGTRVNPAGQQTDDSGT